MLQVVRMVMLMMIQVNYHSAWTPPGKKKSQQLDDCQFSCIFNRAKDNWSISWNLILVRFRQKWSIYVWLRMYLFCNHCTLQTIVEKILFVWSNLFEHLVDHFTYFWIVTRHVWSTEGRAGGNRRAKSGHFSGADK